MKHRFVIVGIMAFAMVSFAIAIFSLLSKEAEKNKPPVSNWEWEDDWNSPPLNVSKVNQNSVQSEKLVAKDYAEALVISGKLGKPILVYFEAKWCHYCNEMKSETLSNREVKEMLKHYVFVYVNSDLERGLCKQFGVGPIPAYVITNVDQVKLKQGMGKQSPKRFIAWLNDSNLFSQPKRNIRVEIISSPQS